MGKLFGTDGIRGVFGKDLTEQLAYKTAVAAASVLSENSLEKTRVIIATDTRESGIALANAMAKGFSDSGADVYLLGVIPTPAVAYLIKLYNVTMGVMISASHNPYEYNGIKIFASDGCKLPDSIEYKIEDLIENFNEPSISLKGEIKEVKTAAAEYADFVVKNSPVQDLSGIKAVVDCACGSASETARLIFDALSLNAIYIHDDPDGKNINNKCGSTYLNSLVLEVQKNNADIGLAFDGDADRFLAVTPDGMVIDGDRIIAALALWLKQKGKLNLSSVAVTTMTNMGFLRKMEENGITCEITGVGDRYVLECMREKGLSIGGEQSGHIILLDINMTGDGQMTAVMLLSYLVETGLDAKAVRDIFVSYPQVLLNLKADKEQKELLQSSDAFKEEIKKSEELFGQNGRILIRPSGTEPLVRIMAEGSPEICESVKKEAERLLACAEKIISQRG